MVELNEHLNFFKSTRNSETKFCKTKQNQSQYFSDINEQKNWGSFLLVPYEAAILYAPKTK